MTQELWIAAQATVDGLLFMLFYDHVAQHFCKRVWYMWCFFFLKGSVHVEKIGTECVPQLFTGVWRGKGVCVCVFNWVLLEARGCAPVSALSANVLYKAAGA